MSNGVEVFNVNTFWPDRRFLEVWMVALSSVMARRHTDLLRSTCHF